MAYNTGGEKLDTSQDPNCSQTNIRWIKVERINADDNHFKITSRRDVDDLVASIRRVGLLHPLLLTAKAQGYIIVSGFRRMDACRQLGWHQVPAVVLSSQIGLSGCIELSITDNCLQRPLNLVETARALTMLARLHTESAHLAVAAANLGLPDNPAMIAKLVKISTLPGPIQNGILNNTISLAMALELGQFDADIGVVMVALFAELKVGLNRQRELILLIKEIALRENISIADVLNADAVTTILTAKDLDRNIKSQRLRSCLRLRRYPSLMKAEENFETHLKLLKLGKGITLVPPRDFEGRTYHLSLAFNSLSELAACRSRLEEIAEHPSLAEILNRGS